MHDKFSQEVFNKDNVIDAIMQSYTTNPGPFLVKGFSDTDIQIANELNEYTALIKYINEDSKSIQEFDLKKQEEWFMPLFYKDIDIAKHILDMCDSDSELQRCGQELILYQEKNLFNLLRYMLYLVDTMTKNKIIWGVGRGSSAASYVLYKLKVHRIDSLYYDLNIKEFLHD